MILVGQPFVSQNARYPGLRARTAGASIVEVLIVCALVAVLAVLSFAAAKGIQDRVAEVTCKARMKRIYHALDSYVKDNGHWPQPPNAGDGDLNEEDEWKWWYEELLPYGIEKEHWLCPIEEKEIKRGSDGPDASEYAASFIPTEFDSKQLTPYRWNQPWLMERGDFHRKGNNMVYPDGSIITAPSTLGILPRQ